MKQDILNIENLTLKIGDKRVLDSVSINIRKGEIFTLVGESGSGKSLTALAIMRLLPNGAVVEDGDIIFNSISIFKLPEYRVRELRGSKISMVFQEPMGALNPVIMVGEQVREIIDIHLGDNIDSKERVLELFREVGLNNPEIKYSSYPHQLSGGEKQRVVIAIALACEPQLLIADELTTALDVTIQVKILNLLEDIQKKRGLSILFITHDMSVVNRISDRVAVMRDGKLLEVSDRVNFFKNPTHPYTKQLIRDFLILKEKKDTRDTTQNILEVKDLKVYFKAESNFFSRNLKAIKAVDGISFTVQEGKSPCSCWREWKWKKHSSKSYIKTYRYR